jgi:acyl-CoA synthetase (AMP-forming)/AMP-acid ligase II
MGGQVTLDIRSATVPEMLQALEGCTAFGARFVNASGREEFHTYADVVERARRAAGALQAAGLKPGERVALILPTSIQFLDAFLGTQLAGGIPAALYPPFRLGKLDEYYERLRRMLSKIGARYLITDTRLRRILGPAVEGTTSIHTVIDAATLQSGAPGTVVVANPAEPAFLQFSSGSTVEPKAVIVSHTNLVHNLAMMLSSLGPHTEQEAMNGAVTWLPLYHDMGLVGCLYLGLYRPATITYLSPELFIGRPAIWLQTISRYRGAISPAPHFAYGLCLKKIRDEELENVDLSSWRYALNGAEPIDVETMERFSERFARWGFRPEALTPVYGLAEAGLGVSFSDPSRPPLVTEFDRDSLATDGVAVRGTGRKSPSVGKPMPGLAIEIRDENDSALPQGRVGRIVVKGPSITPGYFADPELTDGMIRDGWLDTGDLGFVFEDEIYISGRAKDLIIIRGKNYAPQEFEELLLDIEGVRTGCTVAAGTMVDGLGEQLIILAEKDVVSDRNPEEIAAEIETRILNGLSLNVHDIVLLPPGTLPRTSSGKLRRSDALRQYLSDTLTPPEKVTTPKLLQDLGKSQLAWVRFAWQKRKRGSGT